MPSFAPVCSCGAEVQVRLRLLEMTTPNKTPPGADPKQLERTGTVREIGSQAVWSLSSCKPGFGVDQLRDDNLETYWQSDGSQPHLVNIQFRRKTTVKTLCIYADYKSDESYTPSKISVRVGNNFHNLQEIRNGCGFSCHGLGVTEQQDPSLRKWFFTSQSTEDHYRRCNRILEVYSFQEFLAFSKYATYYLL
ncbi:anaphase-promoting complex subunit 10 isoform X2 [Lagopus muta]|uniref:anaphase-promoting complex subunit 10 isoform X2 n=1 Tax=Lagopus muta TaxID=64668 RepID=UPI00209D8135|nr:anaphase-promoting complex subunit 10 isoform X2 [Lagopus muta]